MTSPDTLASQVPAFVTHQVTNQVPPLVGFDPVACDPALTEALATERHGVEFGPLAALAGSAQAREHARLANENHPSLRTHDRYGNRIDEVEFHPSWHWLMSTAVGNGLHAAPWGAVPGSGAHLARAAKFYVWAQVEAGHGCPISMTYAAIPALRESPELAARYEPGLLSPVYDFGLGAPAGKSGLLAGMSMTEKQGGSDVRAGSTVATRAGDGSYRLVGHKWFTSAPMNDLFLTLAHVGSGGGLSCFLLPRVLPDGSRNAIRLERLKDKLGNRSNASAELEYAGATGWLIGEEGRGVRTIIEMVSMTRLDCVLGSAACQRAALSEAAWHAAHRSAFGARLTEAPAMAAVLADLGGECAAATTLAMRLAASVDRTYAGDNDEAALLRIALPASKYYVCKRTPTVVAEALECLGGNGYIEESGMPRLYREAPLMSIWEGSGNVTALDVLRAISRDPSSVDALLSELDSPHGTDPRYDAAVATLRRELAAPEQARARRLAELIALCLQASLLLRGAPGPVADTFIATRLGDECASTLGILPTGTPVRQLVGRITPH